MGACFLKPLLGPAMALGKCSMVYTNLLHSLVKFLEPEPPGRHSTALLEASSTSLGFMCSPEFCTWMLTIAQPGISHHIPGFQPHAGNIPPVYSKPTGGDHNILG